MPSLHNWLLGIGKQVSLTCQSSKEVLVKKLALARSGSLRQHSHINQHSIKCFNLAIKCTIAIQYNSNVHGASQVAFDLWNHHMWKRTKHLFGHRPVEKEAFKDKICDFCQLSGQMQRHKVSKTHKPSHLLWTTTVEFTKRPAHKTGRFWQGRWWTKNDLIANAIKSNQCKA